MYCAVSRNVGSVLNMLYTILSFTVCTNRRTSLHHFNQKLLYVLRKVANVIYTQYK